MNDKNLHRINNMICRLITIIEGELDKVEHGTTRDKMKHNKIITESLMRLAQLTTQLQKISKTQPEPNILSQEDMNIIDSFLERTKNLETQS